MHNDRFPLAFIVCFAKFLFQWYDLTRGGTGSQTTKPSRTAANVTRGSHKPIKDRSKFNGRGDLNPAKAVAQAVEL